MKYSLIIILLFSLTTLKAQSRKYDLPIEDLPEGVENVLKEYLSILKDSEDLDVCAKAFVKIAGGGLVNEKGLTLRRDVKPFSLKKDYNNIKFYASPFQISRINSNPNPITSGFGESAIRGRVFKIWIKKAAGQAGYPAPISILDPEGHPTIQSPKIIRIGSL